MNPIDLQKTALRKQIKKLKSVQTEPERITASNDTIHTLEKTAVFRSAKTVMAFWSMEDEVATHQAIVRWAETKTIILPSVKGSILELRVFHGTDQMKTGEQFGIAEPESPPFTDLASIDLILVPGVAFDLNNNRMGRGKAYYDQLLCATKAFKMGIGFDFQLLEQIPAASHDIRMNQIITNKRTTVIQF
ncbi:MAG: 5-formyltetrahydrofolate cyclo-ligase [Bacteroidia bacterium]|nr:5-formyltetrahydrofolate cyclo-ligase [Bacteroidia bacterium]